MSSKVHLDLSNAPKTVVICGDLHGKTGVVKKCLQTGEHVIFVGDYLDSFDRSIEDQAATLDLVLAAVAEGKATALLGNHEMSYIRPMTMRASGWRPRTQNIVWARQADIISLMSLAAMLPPNILITHAGITKALWDEHMLDTSDTLHRIAQGPAWLRQIGRARGGMDDVGGIFWCDWNAEFEPVPGVRQVVGHSAALGRPLFDEETQHGLRKSSNGDWNIDCLDHVETVLLYDGGDLRPYVL